MTSPPKSKAKAHTKAAPVVKDVSTTTTTPPVSNNSTVPEKQPAAMSPSAAVVLSRPVSEHIRRRFQLLSALLQLNDGRDKLLKVVQYFFKVLLWSHVKSGKSHPFLHPRISSVASNFSTTRKILRLGHAVEPYLEVHGFFTEQQGFTGLLTNKQQQSPAERLLQLMAVVNALVGIANDVVDDVICLAKIGALEKSWVKRLDPHSSRLWMSSIVMDLIDNYVGLGKLVQKEQAAARKGEAVAAIREKKRVQTISFIKLMSDFTFCYVDVANMSGRRADGIQAFSGFLSGVLSLYKLCLKNSPK
ncbi:hypothetical protein RI367_007051 [Sorochytrium milnesiophthora]